MASAELTDMSNKCLLFYRSFDGNSNSIAFEATGFLTPEEVLERLGVTITEDIRLLTPDFMDFLERHYVNYVADTKAQRVCENYVDFVIRYFRHELTKKPLRTN